MSCDYKFISMSILNMKYRQTIFKLSIIERCIYLIKYDFFSNLFDE